MVKNQSFGNINLVGNQAILNHMVDVEDGFENAIN